MNPRIVRTLIAKDLKLYLKNRFFAFITILGLVAYIVIYFLLPNAVDETLKLGLYAPTLPDFLAGAQPQAGLALVTVSSEDALKEGVLANEYPVGVSLPADFAQQIAAGTKPQVHVYVSSAVPREFTDIYNVVLEEMAFNIAGQPLEIDATEEVLGPDLAGQQIPPRDRLLPLLAVLVLMIETLSLASLISSEIEGGTLRALFVTPMRISGLFVGKGIFGVSLAFVQAALLMGITGGLSHEPILILLALLLGAMLVTGIGFMMASVARDILSVIGWGILALVLLAIPAFNILLPGLATNWIRILPSFYLVDTVHRVINFDATAADVTGNLLILFVYAAAFFALGALILRRRFQ